MPNDIRVLSSTAMKTTIDDLTAEFEQRSGSKLICRYGPSTRIAREVADGAENDVTIVTDEGIELLIDQGRLQPGSRVDIARSPMALAVQQGAPRPDISTPEKFKQAMLAAKSLAMSNPIGGGVSGAILIRIFEQLDIAEQMTPKLTFGPGGPAGLIGNFLVRKEVEVGIQQLPELKAVPGINIIGPLPFGTETVSVFSGGISTAAKNPEGAKAFLDFLAGPTTATIVRSKGMEAAGDE